VTSRSRAVRCLVGGRVQGVYFRAATVERATVLGLCGWVRNLPDRRVEVLASGDSEAVAALTEWLWEGPPRAKVVSVAVEEWIGPVPDDFSAR
jgi:acylphosphatase